MCLVNPLTRYHWILGGIRFLVIRESVVVCVWSCVWVAITELKTWSRCWASNNDGGRVSFVRLHTRWIDMRVICAILSLDRNSLNSVTFCSVWPCQISSYVMASTNSSVGSGSSFNPIEPSWCVVVLWSAKWILLYGILAITRIANNFRALLCVGDSCVWWLLLGYGIRSWNHIIAQSVSQFVALTLGVHISLGTLWIRHFLV